MDLSNYVLVARYDLPEPTRTPAPSGSVLAQEVSAVTYNWDTDTLFVVGDGGTSIVQISKTGQLINSMTLAAGSSPQGTEFYDPEGLTYIGNGQFVMTEERDRNAVLFTYEAEGTLTRSEAQTVDLGTFVPNIGLEGLTYDPLTGGFIFVKEVEPEGIFQTTIDFNAGTASNGSSTTENSVDLFDPAQLGLLDFADVYAFSSNAFFAGTSEEGNLLVLSQESGQILEVDRSGNVLSSLTIVSDPGNPLSVPSQQHEGLTMDANGFLYVVSENGGGDFDHPQVWVYAPSNAPNAAPTGISLANALASIDENTGTVTRVKVADIVVADDGIGTNVFAVTGADAASFEADGTGLYIKAGTVLDFETKTSYSVTVTVNDPSVGGDPDASTNYSLTLDDIVVENGPPVVYISEVAPWSSGNSPVGADWFEVTNGGSSTIDLTGWRMDDSSFSFGASVALNGVASLAPGQSAIFLEGGAAAVTAFIADWFGGALPAGVQVGSYSGGGVGLSTGGDAVVLFNGAGEQQARVSFGTSPATAPFATFDNSAGLNDTTITELSKVGIHSAFNTPGASDEIGSPGTVGRVIISEVAPWSSGNSPVGADWFEVTNTSAFAVDITGWRMDDSSGSPAASVALNGVTTLGAGESVIFIETSSQATVDLFRSTWFGDNAPEGLQIGTYSGGVGLSTGSDGVALFNAAGVLQAQVSFGGSPGSAPFATFDNAAGLNNATVTALSTAGVHAAFVAVGDPTEVGSPGAIVNFAPDFTSPAALTTPENRLAVGAVTASDSEGEAIAFLLSGGADADLFVLDGASGELSFAASPDYETPADADHDNVYELEVTARDGFGNQTTQAITVRLTDVAEAGVTIIGGNGGGVHNGGNGDDTIGGGNGNDMVNAGDGDDTATGGNGNDRLSGGRGADALDGGRGNDALEGGAGADRLTGGQGGDAFVFAPGDSTPGAFDRIFDFNSREGDRIDLSAFGIESSDIAITKTSSADYFATVDVDGDGGVDFALAIHSQTPLSADYFIV